MGLLSNESIILLNKQVSFEVKLLSPNTLIKIQDA